LWAAVQSRIQQAAIPTSVSLQLLGSEEPSANLAVNKIETARAFAAIDQVLTFAASIQNYSSKPSAATLLSWRVNEEPAGVTTVPELAPGASTTLSVSHQFSSAGNFEVQCQLESNDDLAADNTGHLLVDV